MKKFKVRIYAAASVLAAVVLAVCLFASCSSASKTRWRIVSQVGAFGGNKVGVMVWLHDDMVNYPCVINEVTVNGIFIGWTGTPQYDIVVYEKEEGESGDGAFMHLQQAYDEGVLSDADILAIARRMNELDGPAVRFDGDNLVHCGLSGSVKFYGLTEEQVMGINKAYSEIYYPQETYYDYSIEVTQNLGTYGGNIAVQIYDGNIEDGGARRDFTVGGVTICEVNDALSLWLYGEGGLVSLTEAYDEGLVSVADMEKMAELYIG